MIMKNSILGTLILTILFSGGLFFLQAEEKRIRDDDPLMERYRHAEREVRQAVSEGKMSREEAGRKLREIKGQLWGDQRKKANRREKEDPGHELRQVERRIHEAIEKGEISHEEARKKLTEIHEGHKKESRDREWEMIKRKIEGAVREGKMSREQANEEYERIEHRMHGRDKIAREAQERIRKTEREIQEGVEAGEISPEDARRALREVHEEMNHVIRRKHLALELQDHERRIEQALESGEISKRQAEEKMMEVRRHMAKQFRVDPGEEEPEARRRSEEREDREEHDRIVRRYRETESELKAAVKAGRISGNEAEKRLIGLRKRLFAEESRREGEERHHEAQHHSREGEGREGRRHHEEERELWEAVKRGLDAAVRLGKMQEEEAREIWEDFRSEDDEGEEEDEPE
jgi:polyhydroxyalkanoate synthesis regulator phasin